MAGSEAVLFADHFQAGQMGEYTREVRFPEAVTLYKVKVLGRDERPYPGSSFEGKSFPNIHMLQLDVFAADKMGATSTMPRLRPGDTPGTFAPLDRLVTDCVVFRGNFIRLSVVIYGHVITAGEELADIDHDMVGVAPHLRPLSSFEAEKLDLADAEGGDEFVYEEVLNGGGPGADEASAPPSITRALAMGASVEADQKLMEHMTWLQGLPSEPDILDAEKSVKRLEDLVQDLFAIARNPATSAALLAHGPRLTNSLLHLIARCVHRLELRQLCAAFRALAAALCSAPAVAEVLRSGGLQQILAVLHDQEWCMSRLKLAALQALLQLCSHAVGMEAFLGWNGPQEPRLPVTTPVSGYEIIVAVAADGCWGHLRLERTAIALLRRADFYMALARLDESCTRLVAADEPAGGGDAGGDEVVLSVIEALSDVAAQFVELSTERASNDSLLVDSIPSTVGDDSPLGSTGTADGVAQVYPQLHGFLESFFAGRRLVPSLSLLLRRLPKLKARDRLDAFVPLRRLVLSLLACVGGAQFLAADANALNTFLGLLDGGKVNRAGAKAGAGDCIDLPAVPRFPEPLTQCAVGAPQLAALVALHVRASRIAMLLVARTRQAGKDGLLPEAEGLKLLCALHRLCARGAAGRDSVICAFRSVFLVEWLLRQLEGFVADAGPAATGTAAGAASAPAPPPQPSLRHLVAILHTLVLSDITASVAERFGAQISEICSKVLEVLEVRASKADGGDVAAYGASSLEFALDSEGAEGGLSRAVRVGRRSADHACMGQLRELMAQLRPWQAVEGEPAPPGPKDLVSTAKLLACLRVSKAPRSFKRSVDENRVSRLSLLLGSYGGDDRGVEVAEVDFVGGDASEHVEVPDERLPPSDLAEIPLLAMRLLCRRAAVGAREALDVILTEDKQPGADAAPATDGLSVMVPVLIRCLSALNLNLEALTLQEGSKSIDEIYATQQAHAQLLEAALKTCFHLLRGLRAAGLSQYRHTDMLHVLLLLADRLSSNIVGVSPSPAGSDPEFRLLWRHCLTWVCCVFRAWVQSFPAATGGQLLQPLLRHTRVLAMHFVPGLLLLATCGSLRPLLPTEEFDIKIVTGQRTSDVAAAENSVQSHPILLPSSTRGGALGHVVLKVHSSEKQSPFSRSPHDTNRLFGQFWGKDCEADDWDGPDWGPTSPAYLAMCARDPLVYALSRRQETSVVASALALVGHVNARRERFQMDDLAELIALLAQSSVTSDALLHLVTVRVLDKLTCIGVPVLDVVLRLGEAALGADTEQLAIDADDALPDAALQPLAVVGDPRDGRAVSRILMLLMQFGQRGPVARAALLEHRAETLCLSVLAHSSSTLPYTVATQAVRVLSLMFCYGPNCNDSSRRPSNAGGANGRTASADGLPTPSVTKCRLVTKALSMLINRKPEEGHSVGPATMASSLQLLLNLSATRSMCLNLLFSTAEESVAEGKPAGSPLPVSVSCAFRLAPCIQRLAHELKGADERWDSTERGSELETEAEEALMLWLTAAELLVSLCQTVLVNCPTVTVFISLISGGTPPDSDSVDEAMLKGILGEVNSIVLLITGRRRAEAPLLRAAALVGNIGAFEKELLETTKGPPPSTLVSEELCPPWSAPTATPSTATGSSTTARQGDTCSDEDDVLAEVVGLFTAAAELEADQEWLSVAELDSADAPPEGSASAAWEFDAVACRKKRQAMLEKAEMDRKTKRLKQTSQRDAQRDAARTTNDRDPRARRSRSRDKAPRRDPSPARAPDPRPAETPSPASAGAAPTAPAAPPAAKQAGAQEQAAALSKFVKDHPEFMRVLQNPKKELGDPRKKSMFVKELQNYPLVKKFFESKGLVLN